MTFMCNAIGSFSNLEDVHDALNGAYGVWVNTDSFAIGEQHEVYLGMRIFEVSKQVKTLRHYVWSNLDYNLKVFYMYRSSSYLYSVS